MKKVWKWLKWVLLIALIVAILIVIGIFINELLGLLLGAGSILALAGASTFIEHKERKNEIKNADYDDTYNDTIDFIRKRKRSKKDK